MDWQDERFVRLYTRDTADWLTWPWQSRALFPLLMRKADRVGRVSMGRSGLAGLAVLDRIVGDGRIVNCGLASLRRSA